MRNLNVTVSGSFHRHMGAIGDAVRQLHALGVTVLSPSDPRVVDGFGDFLFVASDVRRSIRGIQNRHFDAIRRSDFLWLECPDGYVGSSACLEVGFAVASGVDVIASAPPSDLTVRQYVEVAATVADAVRVFNHRELAGPEQLSLLLEPDTAIDAAHAELEMIRRDLISSRWTEHDPAEARIARVRELISGPIRAV